MKLVLIDPRNPVSLYGDYLWQPLAFGYVAAATPAGAGPLELIDEQVEAAAPEVARRRRGRPRRLDRLHTAGAARLQIAAQFRSRGIPVVMGSIASLVQEEAAQHADALFIGECETLWPTVVADVEAGRLQPIYNGGTKAASLLQPKRSIFEKYDWVESRRRRHAAARWTARSAPVTVFNGRLFRMRTVGGSGGGDRRHSADRHHLRG